MSTYCIGGGGGGGGGGGFFLACEDFWRMIDQSSSPVLFCLFVCLFVLSRD